MLWKALAQEERGPLWHNSLSFLEMFVLLKGEKKNIVAREINTPPGPLVFRRHAHLYRGEPAFL